MPLTIKTGAMYYKDPVTGNYVPINAIGDMTSEMIAPFYEELTFPVAEGTPCVHENVIYRANQAISTSETWTAAHWTAIANVMSEIQGIKRAVDDIGNPPKLKNSEEEDVDLDVSDPDGNVIVRLEDGHIKTKNFNSKKQPVRATGSDATADLDISDTIGNIILRLKNGNIETKWFNSTYIRQLTGKKWAAMGDSLTEVNRRTTKHYHDYIAEETGISVYNMGSSGTGYKRHENDNIAFYQRILNVPADSDVVTIFGSFNDLGGGYDLGTATDTGTSTLGGCINTTIDNLYSVIPGVHLGIVSPTPWDNITPSGTSGNNYCGLLADICKRRSIPFLDLFHCSNLRPWDSSFLAVAYTKDEGNGVHPDETGHALITPMFRQFLFSLI